MDGDKGLRKADPHQVGEEPLADAAHRVDRADPELLESVPVF